MCDKQLSEFKNLYEEIKYKGLECRREAARQTTRAEIYEDCLHRVEKTIWNVEKLMEDVEDGSE